MRSFITVQALLCLIIAALVIGLVDSTCDVCSPISGVACVSETQFLTCSGGVADPNSLTNCPTGTFCADSSFICEGNAVPSCQECGTCSADGRFACTSLNTFALCYGGAIPANSTYTCPVNTVCDPNAVAPDFCSVDNGNITTCDTSTPPPGTTSSTSTTTTTTTTTEPTTTTQSPTNWCLTKGTVGRFPISTDLTCKSYYFCYAYQGAIQGATYSCEGTTIFRPDLQQCVAPTTYQCPTSTTTPTPVP